MFIVTNVYFSDYLIPIQHTFNMLCIFVDNLRKFSFSVRRDLPQILVEVVGVNLGLQFCFSDLVLKIWNLRSLFVFRRIYFDLTEFFRYFLQKLQANHQRAQNQSTSKEMIPRFLDLILPVLEIASSGRIAGA